MFALWIKDFGVNTEHVFTQAVPFDESEIASLSEAMLRAFSSTLLPKDITLDQGDRLFDYRLAFGIFNGSVDISVTSAGLTATFRNGRNKKALKLIADILAALEIVVQRHEILVRRLTFAAHARFQDPKEYEIHMGNIADKSRGYSAGGLILHTSKNPFKGDLRFSTDKSLVYEDSLFLSGEFLIEEPFSAETLSKMAERFAEVGKDVQLEIQADE